MNRVFLSLATLMIGLSAACGSDLFSDGSDDWEIEPFPSRDRLRWSDPAKENRYRAGVPSRSSEETPTRNAFGSRPSAGLDSDTSLRTYPLAQPTAVSDDLSDYVIRDRLARNAPTGRGGHYNAPRFDPAIGRFRFGERNLPPQFGPARAGGYGGGYAGGHAMHDVLTLARNPAPRAGATGDVDGPAPLREDARPENASPEEIVNEKGWPRLLCGYADTPGDARQRCRVVDIDVHSSISLEPMTEAVSLRGCGHTVNANEAGSLRTCPICRAPAAPGSWRPNLAMRAAARVFQAALPDGVEEASDETIAAFDQRLRDEGP